ncbi:endonuclease/exonuclease/phosphatase family protein [Propionivibrio sp.]|uniref:endonuclease/exonuclease/phosphatase family protein n=1 Tax=Propionivibrio sp. TaxID=2212460 RepID=UPI003BF0FBEC
MDKINLCYAKSLITRKTKVAQQNLSFVVLLEDIAYEKSVDVTWAGEDGVWHTLPAFYHSSVNHNREYWVASMAFPLASDKSLPGNIQFALRYQVADGEYWDNNQGENYSIQADSGIMAGHDFPILNTGFECSLPDGERILPIAVAIDSALEAQRVTIHWTSDNWKTTHTSPCRFARNHWDTEHLSNARNPNQYGCQIWNAALQVNDAFRVKYKISYDTPQRVMWDDNFGQNYVIQRPLLKVLILNLHCCQEENQDFKLSQIAKAIDEQDVDIVCLQEVAELWNNGMGDWETNTARIINERLKSPCHLVTDWSHIGFDRYREGVAILSKHPIERHEGRYVSNNDDPYSIHSRKVVMAQVRVPHVGSINVFSSHLSWWDDGFPAQFENLRLWAANEHTSASAATMLCGDFNIKAGSKGYQHVVESNEYDDQYLLANSPDIFRTIFEVEDSPWYRYLEKDHRIDYIFLRKGSDLCVTTGREVFSDQDYGRVSDHVGYLMTFVPL